MYSQAPIKLLFGHKDDIPGSFYYPSTASSDDDNCEPTANSELRKFYDVGPLDEIDHIIDSSNGPQEIIDCNKNIRGNLIVVRGKWNTGVGQLCWADVEAEKKEVYGDVIFNRAYNAVKSCCASQNNMSIFYACAGIVAIFTVSGTVVYLLHQFSQDKRSQAATVYELGRI